MTLVAWLPMLALPAGVWLLTPNDWPRWLFMWLCAGAVFVGSKWMSWCGAESRRASLGRHAAYFNTWTGLDADAFLHGSSPARPGAIDWLFALAKLAFGNALIVGAYPMLADAPVLLRGWVGMFGVVFVLHFGLFHLIALGWRAVGVDAAPIMNWPIKATSVSAFWSRHWNLAFRDWTHRLVFRPLAARLGARGALAAVFLFSGIVHDLIISLPAGAGWGGPTIYFLLQSAALFFERSAFGQRLGLGQGWRGWAFTMTVLIVPLGLLFHPPFVVNVAVPFLDWINS